MARNIEDEFWEKQTLVKGLTEEQLLFLQSQFIEESYLPDDSIITEGEVTNDLYIIFEGEVNVLKWDESHQSQTVLGKLEKGDVFGEMSFMDNSPRSSTIKATKPTKILRLPKKMLEITSTDQIRIQDGSENLDLTKILRYIALLRSKIFANIALINIDRLRAANILNVGSLQKKQTTLLFHQEVAKLIFYEFIIIGIFCLAAFLFPEEFRVYVPWIGALLPTLFLTTSFDFKMAHFGWNLKNWPTVLITSLIISGIILGGIYALAIAFPAWITDKNFIDWKFHLTADSSSEFFWITWLIYPLYCFSQEFIARGVIQTWLRDFLEDVHGYKSIWVMSILMLIFQLPFGFMLAVLTFLNSLFLGFVYLKQKTLLGVFLIHFLIGISMGFIV